MTGAGPLFETPGDRKGESREDRVRRLGIRSWRRGMKEMDLILGPYADAMLGRMDAETLDAYEAMLSENDQLLYAWVSGRAEPDPRHRNAVAAIRAHHGF